MQAAQDVRVGGRPTRTQFQFTLQDANLDELNEWAPKILEKMKTLAELRDVATDQQSEGTTLQLTIDRDTASRYGIQPQLIDDTLYDAFGQRQVTQYFTQLNSYHVILEVLPELQGDMDTLNKIYVKSPTTGDQVPLSTFASWTSVPVRPLSISHQGQFPAITISFNLAPGRRSRPGDRCRAEGDDRTWRAGDAQFELPGHGPGIPAVAGDGAVADPRSAGRGLSRSSASSTRATSTRSPFCRRCRRPASARSRS